jgi:hypothetical protein
MTGTRCVTGSPGSLPLFPQSITDRSKLGPHVFHSCLFIGRFENLYL